jgi:hypothetical protein
LQIYIKSKKGTYLNYSTDRKIMTSKDFQERRLKEVGSMW